MKFPVRLFFLSFLLTFLYLNLFRIMSCVLISKSFIYTLSSRAFRDEGEIILVRRRFLTQVSSATGCPSEVRLCSSSFVFSSAVCVYHTISKYWLGSANGGYAVCFSTCRFWTHFSIVKYIVKPNCNISGHQWYILGAPLLRFLLQWSVFVLYIKAFGVVLSCWRAAVFIEWHVFLQSELPWAWRY